MLSDLGGGTDGQDISTSVMDGWGRVGTGCGYRFGECAEGRRGSLMGRHWGHSPCSMRCVVELPSRETRNEGPGRASECIALAALGPLLLSRHAIYSLYLPRHHHLYQKATRASF